MSHLVPLSSVGARLLLLVPWPLMGGHSFWLDRLLSQRGRCLFTFVTIQLLMDAHALPQHEVCFAAFVHLAG